MSQVYHDTQLNRVFYDGKLYLERERFAFQDLPKAVYNGGYVRSRLGNWFRCDLTPVRSEDVPAWCRTLELLLGLPAGDWRWIT